LSQIANSRGFLQLGYSLERLNAEQQRDQLAIAGFALFFAVLGIALAFGLAIWLSRPIRRLVEATKRIGEGDLDAPTNIDATGEIGALAAAFTEMTENLRQSTVSRVEAEKLAASEQEKSIKLSRANKELAQTQKQLVHAEKLKALGELGAGMAHELNQPLTAVIGIISTIAKDLPPSSALREPLHVVEQQGRRMALLVRQVLTFSRPSTPSLIPVDVAAIIDDTVGLLGPELRSHGVGIGVMVEPLGLTALASPRLLQQILLNLLTNARDAIELYKTPNGRIEINVSLVADGNGNGNNDRQSIDSFKRRDLVRLVMTDNGADIDNKTVGRLFEPFFTTRSRAEGAGLGLSISHGIMRDMGGDIVFERDKNGRKQFIVTLNAA